MWGNIFGALRVVPAYFVYSLYIMPTKIVTSLQLGYKCPHNAVTIVLTKLFIAIVPRLRQPIAIKRRNTAIC